MKIRVMTVCKDEERIMPFFIRHYEPWVDEIVIIDGGSTDKSLEIAKNLGNGKVKSWQAEYDDGKFVNDLILRKIRNEEWKEGRESFDWIIVCDNDEMLYHPNILTKLKEYQEQGITLPLVEGYQMVSMEFPDPSYKITDQVQRGFYFGGYSKHVIFNPKQIVEMNYTPGSHSCFPIGNVIKPNTCELKLLHYRMLGYSYNKNKAAITADRLEPDLLKNFTYGFHNLDIANKFTFENFVAEYDKASKII